MLLFARWKFMEIETEKNNNSMQCAFVTMAKVNQFENKNNIQYQFA